MTLEPIVSRLARNGAWTEERDGMRIDRDLFDCALHEARHSAYGAWRHMEVLAVHVGAREGGYTDLRLPFGAYGLQQYWNADPLGTVDKLVNILGMIISPVACEKKLFPAECGDTQKLRQYRIAWSLVKPTMPSAQRPPAWMELLHRATHEVQQWASAGGAVMAQYELATWLAREGDVDAEQWQWLWDLPSLAVLRQFRPAVSTRLPTAAASRSVPATVPTPKTYGFSTPGRARPLFPDYPLGVWDTAWVEKNRKQTATADILPVPSVYDWRTGFVLGRLGIVA